ncbi:MAG: hypothetical protein LLG37_04160 [Spirochaetia bacterium]|nr:hypothetical protein [Spirochaetia bacterium]
MKKHFIAVLTLVFISVLSFSCSQKRSPMLPTTSGTNIPTRTATIVATSTHTMTRTATMTPTINTGLTSTDTPTATVTTTTDAAEVMFADFEAANAGNNRGGWTYVSCDAAQIYGDSITASGGGYGGTGYAYRVTITTADTIVYCNIESQLSENAATAVDISGYSGIKFWAKGTGSFKFMIPDAIDWDTPSYTFTLNSVWTEYTVVFLTMTRGGWGTLTIPQLLATCKVLDWAPAAISSTYDIYIDNIRFY